VRCGRGNADRAAIRRCLGDCIGAQIAPSARTVLDDDGPEGCLDLIGEYPDGDVDRATSGIGNDNAQRFAGADCLRSNRQAGQGRLVSESMGWMRLRA
jgi:hypothetical protein